MQVDSQCEAELNENQINNEMLLESNFEEVAQNVVESSELVNNVSYENIVGL
jgi:hypothetical protein